MNAVAATLEGAVPEQGLRLAGWLPYLWLILGLTALLQLEGIHSGQMRTVALIGGVGLWRYSLGFLHFVRAMIFLYLVFPEARRAATRLGAAGLPPHVYFLVTSFRIEASTTASVYRSVIAEAMNCGRPATVVCSIVELADERLIRALWERFSPQPHVKLCIVRIPGTGKRDGIAHALRAISRDLPHPDAVVALIDGDTALRPGCIRDTAPFFKLFPNMGAMTTNEFCRVDGSAIQREWHRLRFAQRHLNMCSMALGKRVLTLTGRMSLFRASIVTQREFIEDVEDDHLDHWRLGSFRFLTGDDKSSWYSLARQGWETYYVPDVAIDTLEHPPHKSFFTASRQLMFRWYGNSLRQNSRAVRLGPGRLGAFTWYVLWDQRISMWTSLFGLSAALVGTLRYGWVVLVGYTIWIIASRVALSLLLAASGHRIGPAFPALLYYNQIVGAVMKIRVFFHLDQQSWTRQKTALVRDLDPYQVWFNRWSSRALTFASASVFAAVIVTLV